MTPAKAKPETKPATKPARVKIKPRTAPPKGVTKRGKPKIYQVLVDITVRAYGQYDAFERVDTSIRNRYSKFEIVGIDEVQPDKPGVRLGEPNP